MESTFWPCWAACCRSDASYWTSAPTRLAMAAGSAANCRARSKAACLAAGPSGVAPVVESGIEPIDV